MNEESIINRAFNNIFGWFPTLERDDRHDLHERIELGATGNADFYIMMVLASALASLGLLQGSAAVVIGAMIVAPLMGPLLGAGLALVQGNLKLMRGSLFIAISGVVLGLTISILFGIINPNDTLTMEQEARGNPDVFDLFIALFSGMIAAYAQGRPSVSNTLAGVAIAAALLPPLAVVGIAGTSGHFLIAANAAVLLVTNLVVIVIGAALIFRLLGVRVTQRKTGFPGWARRAELSLLLIAVVFLTPLLLQGMDKYEMERLRPSSYPVSKSVQSAVEEYISDYPSMVIINIARVRLEPESDVTIVLSTLDPVPIDFRSKLARTIRQARGEDILGLEDLETTVRIFIMQEAPILIE